MQIDQIRSRCGINNVVSFGSGTRAVGPFSSIGIGHGRRPDRPLVPHHAAAQTHDDPRCRTATRFAALSVLADATGKRSRYASSDEPR